MIAYTDYAIDARVIRLAETASRNGYSVDLLTPRKKGARRRETINNVNLYRLLVKPYGGFSITGYIFSYLSFFAQCFLWVSFLQLRRRYKIVHVHNMPDFLIFSAVLATFLGARPILDIHDPMPEMYTAKFPNKKRGLVYHILLLQERLSAAFAARVLAVHEPLKRDVLMKDGLNPDKISVIANFPDDEMFRPRRRFLISRKIRLIYYGTLDTRFGLEDTLESIARLGSRSRLYLKIIGQGDRQSSIKKLIQERKLESTVDFENRVYPLHEIPALLAQFHLGLVPYKLCPATRYMLPVKFVELIAMGLPAITVANVPIRFYFDESMYFAYDPERITSLTDLISRIIENPELILEKRRAILSSRTRYLWTHEGQKYLEVLNSLSSARKA
jgi:glycosyltransferase involved in cell wall biosynthesis